MMKSISSHICCVNPLQRYRKPVHVEVNTISAQSFSFEAKPGRYGIKELRDSLGQSLVDYESSKGLQEISRIPKEYHDLRSRFLNGDHEVKEVLVRSNGKIEILTTQNLIEPLCSKGLTMVLVPLINNPFLILYLEGKVNHFYSTLAFHPFGVEDKQAILRIMEVETLFPFGGLPIVLRADKEIALRAVTKNPYNFNFLPYELRNDQEVVLATVNQKGEMLRYAGKEMIKDRVVASAAFHNDPKSYLYMAEPLRSEFAARLRYQI